MRWGLIFLLLAVGCQDPISEQFLDEEQAFRESYNQTPINVSGRITDRQGAAISSVMVRLGEQETTSGSSGEFSFVTSRANAPLTLSHSDYYTHHTVVHLSRDIDVESIELQPMTLMEDTPDTVRMIFTGDVALGRRFLDPTDTTSPFDFPEDHDDALIRVSSPEEGTSKIFDHVREFLAAADYTLINLETPVTNDVSTPHPSKKYVFFTLPGSMQPIKDAGVDFVGFGNNHLYDYLDVGLMDTLHYAQETGFDYTGAGMTNAEALIPVRKTLKGQKYSILSATSIAGDFHDIDYVAGAAKGGAADLRDEAMIQSVIDSEIADGYKVLASLHVGKEYGEKINDSTRQRLVTAQQAGSSLVVGHHPHVVEGVEFFEDTLMVHSLGNFAFDQARLETMLGATLVVDFVSGELVAASLVPVYLEDFKPRLIGGKLLQRELRRVGALSSVAMAVSGNRGNIAMPGDIVPRQTQSVAISVTNNGADDSIVDLREFLPPQASLVSVAASDPNIIVSQGRDILTYGDFEDYDNDGETLEVSRWDHSSDSAYVCMKDAYRGAAALCSIRDVSNGSISALPFRNRVRLLGFERSAPNKNVSVVGYTKSDNAGPVEVVTRYFAPEGPRLFGEEKFPIHIGGTSDWKFFSTDLTFPEDTEAAIDDFENQPWAMRLFFHHTPPTESVGKIAIDEVAIVTWELGPIAPVNNYEFLRLSGASSDATITVTYSIETQ